MLYVLITNTTTTTPNITPTGGQQHHYSSAHGVYIFPGVALGTVMARCSKIRTDMLVAAAQVCGEVVVVGGSTISSHHNASSPHPIPPHPTQTVAAMVTDEDRAAGRIFPAVNRAREIAAQVAKAVAAKGYDAGIATELPKPHDLLRMAQRSMYYPGMLAVAWVCCVDVVTYIISCVTHRVSTVSVMGGFL